MAYGDVIEFRPGPVSAQTYSDGTSMPHLEIDVYRNGVKCGYVEVHAHRVKYPPHISIGVTSRVTDGGIAT